MSDFERARRNAEIIHTEGMRKALTQLADVLERQIQRLDERLASLRDVDLDDMIGAAPGRDDE